jgi:hypothetical protein
LIRLSVEKNTDESVWYPLWTVGHPGAATLLTANFGRSGVRFRYDHWGLSVTVMDLGYACSGSDLLVSVRIDQFNRKLTINCNGVQAQKDIPDADTYLGWEDPLGVNNVTDTLEGKYPLAKSFPGKIVEQSSLN